MYCIPEDELKLALRRALNRKPTAAEIKNFKAILDKNRFAWLISNAKELFAKSEGIAEMPYADF